MAPKSLPLIFFLIIIFSTQTLARESRFFSKIPRSQPTKTNEAQEIVNVESKEEDDPVFLPQTSENGSPYGLYSNQPETDFSPSASTTTEKFTQKEEPFNDKMEPINNYGRSKNYATELHGVDSYGNNYYNQKQGMSDTRFSDVQNEKPENYYNGNSYPYQSKNLGREEEYYNNDGYYNGGSESFNKYYYNKNSRPGFQQQDEEMFQFDPRN